jgi:hypothetical protein
VFRLDVDSLDFIDTRRDEYLYYYRALSDHDLTNYMQGNPLLAVNQDKGKTCVNKISRHIKDGSNSKYSECWISACKQFKICATEFSIPQLGNYNTTTKRKQIAVICGKQTNGNLTYLEGKDANNNVLKLRITR